MKLKLKLKKQRVPLAKKAKQGLVPEFRKRFGALNPTGPPRAIAVKGLEPDDRNRFDVLPNLGPTLASVESISAEPTTESYPKPSQFFAGNFDAKTW